MTCQLVRIITSTDPAVRNQSLDRLGQAASTAALQSECAGLEQFRRTADNLYEQVRALFFLYAIHRFHLPSKPGIPGQGLIPFEGYEHVLHRRFEEAIELFLAAQTRQGPSGALSSALAMAYHSLGFQTLANQVRRSVRSVRGNQWMFRTGHPQDHPLRIHPQLRNPSPQSGLFPILRERTPVRMDLSHSGWSDIFFLGMDYPEGARVLNISIDLGIHGRDPHPQPPVEACLRVISEPLLRLTSVDLGASIDVADLAELFDFARDYLGLLKAAVIASGLVPPGLEGSGQSLAELLARLAGEGRGLEIVSRVRNIPKGSRLAVSTTLLAALIAVCMRATGQTHALTGPLLESERRLVAARAILGEWLGGSGGGWQDSGGVWPAFKLIQGELAREGDPEFGISRGRLLPSHRILDDQSAPPLARQRLQDSLILVHGGLAQNVGPILEMVTEKYLLRAAAEWQARQEAIALLDHMLEALRQSDLHSIGAATTRNFFGPIQSIIPWASNLYTETLIQRVQSEFQDRFWGFWMLGGMSGGGMGFLFHPDSRAAAQQRLAEIMAQTKSQLDTALPFAIDPVVYDFAVNDHGTLADLMEHDHALLPAGYYELTVPALLRTDPHRLPRLRRIELDRLGALCRTRPELGGMVQALFDRLLPQSRTQDPSSESLPQRLERHGFDPVLHEQIRADLRTARIGLAQNRLPSSTTIADASPDDLMDGARAPAPDVVAIGRQALEEGRAAVVTLAAGAGSRWTQGAGVVKALHPFAKLGGRHRSFLEVHLAKSRRTGRLQGNPPPHFITTSYLSHDPIQQYLERNASFGYPGPLRLSPGRAVGLRLIPTVRDLRFAWEEMPQQMLDAQAQKVRDSLRAALVNWARQTGEGNDYTDNLPHQCLHPVGHFYEVPNLLRNGTLRDMLALQPQLQYLLLHNIDTVGASLDPALLGLHIQSHACLTFEVIHRRLEDRGGGLARVNGRPRLVEGLALPREEDEFRLSCYNTMTTWIDLDRLLAAFGLTRDDLDHTDKITAAIRQIGQRIPTYITLKEVKKRWGHGQEDVFPVAQFEKLWSDMTALPEVDCRFLLVPRERGQQLKDPAQLDGWLRDGSAASVESLCDW